MQTERTQITQLHSTMQSQQCGNFHLHFDKLFAGKRFLWSFSLDTSISWMVKIKF